MTLRFSALFLLLTLTGLLAPSRCAGQNRVRLGLTLGGIGFAGVVAEWMWEDRSIEVLVSTFTFRDVGVSVAGKQFFGVSWLRPAVGAGLWYLAGRTPDGTGRALVARFPMGRDWRVAGGHYVTWEVNVTRGLVVKRPDPADTAPLTSRIIPFPSLSYRLDPGL